MKQAHYMENTKDQIVRNRKIGSCQRCFKAKRKCDKIRPTCLRCQKAQKTCTYFTKEQTNERYQIRKVVSSALPSSKDTESVILNSNATQNADNTELNPKLSQSENQNFSIIVSSTGEYSKFFPKCFFSFFDHAQNVAMVLNPTGSKIRSLMVFDFSCLVTPFRSLDDIKSRIPSKNTSDLMIKHFFEYILPFVPVVDSNEFMYEYNIYWENPDSFNNKNFIFLMFSIYFCSCTSIAILKVFNYTLNFKNLNDKGLLELDCESLRYISYECIENLKRMLNSDCNPSISVITGLTLIYYLGSSNGSTVSLKISSLVKLAQIFGLHRKLTITETGNLATRDVLYKFIWYMDGLSAYYSGLPPDMHPEICESEDIYNFQSDDIHIMFLSARLCNTHIWNVVLFEFNKINKTELSRFKDIENLYLTSINVVNSINQQIITSNDKSQRYRKWLTTETKMGLRKSMLLVSALKHTLSYSDQQDKKLTTELVIQSMLLINESIYKVKLGMEVLTDAIWFYRFAIPFQAMYIVLSHIQKYPFQHLNFSHLERELDYTVDDGLVSLDYTQGDIRLELVNLSIKTLSFLTTFWIPSNIERFTRLIKFRDFVVDKNNSKNTSSGSPSVEPNEQESVLKNKAPQPGLVEGYDGYLQDTNLFDLDAYAFLNEGSKFWFGDEFEV